MEKFITTTNYFIQPCGLGSVTLEYVNYIMWASQTKFGILFTIHTFHLNLEIWVELYSRHYAQELPFIPWTFARNIVQPNVIPYNHY